MLKLLQDLLLGELGVMPYHKLSLIVAILLLALASQHSAIAEVPVPAGLQPGDTYHLLFNSSTFTNALSSSIDFYNDFVQATADAAGIGVSEGVTWKAVASTASIDARVNAPVGLSTPVYNTNAAGPQKIANGFVSLWDGSIDETVDYDEFGLSNPVDAWTGSTPTGLAATGSTLGHSSGTAWCGRPSLLGSQWLTILQPSTSAQLSVYALSEPLTVPAVSVDADFNADGDIDGDDFLRWQRGNGDADGNGTSDSVDLGHWQQQFGQAPSGATQAFSAITAIPEPSSLILLAIATALATTRRSIRETPRHS